MNDFSNAEKLQDNMGRLDPDYYLSLLQKFQNTDALMKLDIETYERTLKKISTSMDYSYMEASCDFMISIRQNDKEAMKKQLDALLNDPTLPSSIIPTFAGIYSQLFNDDYITITKLEAFNKSYYNWGIITSLAYYYKKQNRIEDAIQLFTESIEKFGDDNNVLYEVILLLHELGDYKRSLPFIDQAIGNFPNSYAFAKFKADAYVQLGKKAEALRLYELAISRNPSASDLRSKINDLKNSKNPLDDFHLNNPYDYISKNRNTVENNNYGLNKLLYQTDILGYDTGGGEYKITMIYEITSQNGLDVFKEYDLDLSGDYLIYKSESVKPDGTTVPADRDGSNLVFDELEIGDVVLIDYEVKYSRSGRFYKDEVLSHSFGGYHPGLIDIYRFISKRENIDYKVTNGELNYKKYKKGELFVNEWSLSNFKGLPLSEDFMPPFSDVTPRLNISTISSWQEIADWYSDLVRKQLKVDGVVEDTFHSIFPQGIEGLSETERAKKIYYYIINNMNYSYVSFRQSGYVPQKPSKTLKTKLGDCKDFSSLFLVLAHKAGLSANLVLILTSDYGKKELVMPSTDFNHCIVKVTVDGKNQYLELTNKYLPFESLPMSLREASALEIPFEKTEKQKATLIYLTNVSREPAVFQSSYVMNLKGDESTIDLKTSVSGHMASYFIETYKTKEDKLLDETILEEISSRASEPVKLKKLKDINYNKDLGIISVETELTSKIKINKIGKLNAFKIPYFLNPYNNAIIQSEQRNFPIDYKAYENTDVYEETMLIILEDNEIIEDIPENVTLSFKSHTFSLEYAVPKPNNLKVEIKCNMGTTDISVLEYEEFKTYVSKYLETKDVMVTFRKTEKS